MKTKFKGMSLDVTPEGLMHIRLKTTNEHFTVERPHTACNNIIIGEMYIDHYGKMTVKNQTTNDICEIDFKKRGWGGKNAHCVEGIAYSPTKEKQYSLKGTWIDHLDLMNLKTGEGHRIWNANPLP